MGRGVGAVSLSFKQSRAAKHMTSRLDEANEMDEGSFDIFAGSPEKSALWVEVVEGFSRAQQRMDQIAVERPGVYFLLKLLFCMVLCCSEISRLH